MSAAADAADETVAFLLSKGASPDLMDKDGDTALVCAIQIGCLPTIDLLAPVTKKVLGLALASLATWQVELTPAVKELLKRASSDEKLVRAGVGQAAGMGATSMLKILTNGWNRNTLHPSDANYLLQDALTSDNAETVQVILAFVSDVSSENLALALTRGRADVVNLFGLGEDERSTEAAKKRLKAAIVNKTASIENRLPKSVEFPYDDEMTKLRPLLSQSTVRYEDLLRALHVPPVHAEEECPGDCRQKEDCDRLRQVYFLVRLLVAKMGEINPVFRLGANRHPLIIGSMKEHTRVFFNNEVDERFTGSYPCLLYTSDAADE